MPEIPKFNPKVAIDTRPGGRFVPATEGYEALQQAGASLARTGAAIQEFQNRQQDANETNKAHALLLRAQEAIEEQLDNLRRTGPGSSDYRREALKIINDEYNRALSESSDLRQKARSFLIKKAREGRLGAVIAAGDYADNIFVDENKSAIEIMLPKLKERIVRAGNPREYQSAVDNLNAYIDSQIGIGLTRPVAEAKRNQLLKEAQVDRLKAAGMFDPVRAMIEADRMAKNPEGDSRLNSSDWLKVQAFLEGRLKSLNAEEDRREAKEEKELKARLSATEAEFFKQIQKGVDVRQEVQELTDVLGSARAKRILDFQEEMKENRLKGIKSNPDTLIRVSTWVNGGIDPETGEERLPTVDEIRQLGINGLLSATHVGFFQQQITSKEKTESKEALTLRNRLITAGQRRINAALKSSGLLERLDPNAQQARAMAMREYQEITTREPKSDPFAVADEIIGRYMKAIFDQGAIYNKKLMNAAPTTRNGRIIDSKDALLEAVENDEVDKRVADVWFDIFEFIEQQQALQGSAAQKEQASKQEKQGFDLGAYIRSFFADKPKLATQPPSGR